jgi:hypothetical protein
MNCQTFSTGFSSGDRGGSGSRVIAASGAYLVEHQAQPDAFGSIPDAMWWAVATLTTVG